MSLITGISFTCISCSQLKDINQDDPFRRLYGYKPSDLSAVQKVSTKVYPTLTLSCYQMPVSLFCRVLSDKFLVGVVYSEALSAKTITAEFKDTDLASVLNVVSRQLSSEIVRVGNTFFIGSLKSEDRGILIRRILGYDQASLDQIIKSMISDKGKSSVMVNGIAVVTDHESVIRRISETLDYLDTLDSDTWIVQLCFVNLRKDALIQAGFDVKSSGTISYNIAESQVDFKDFKLDGLFNFASSSSFADVYSSPMFLLRDGSTSKWQDGQRVPIPRKTVSSEGTVTTSGYDYIDVGFIVDATVYQSKRGGRLKLRIEMSDIKSYVEESPVTSQSVYQFDADLETQKPYLIGELTTFKSLDTQDKVLVFGADKGKAVLQVWAQLYKISGSSQERFKLAKDKVKFIGQHKDKNHVLDQTKK